MKHNFLKHLMRWIILIVIVLSFIELTSYFLYRNINKATYQNQQEIHIIFKKYDVDCDVLYKELSYLFYKTILFHPYRWFSCIKNFNGKYVKTDEYGWRIDRSKVSKDVTKIACFGGSTMFSSTEDTGTIPYHLNSRINTDQVIALNFGVGGYSSTAELMSFIEVVRYEKNIHYAIFYDGVNDVLRYIEYKQRNPSDRIYHYVGYPYPYVSDKSMRNHLHVPDLRRLIYIPYSLKFIKQLLVYNILPKSIASSQVITDYDKEANIITQMYIDNVKDITVLCKANNITPIFLLQPNIFTLSKRLFNERVGITLDYDKKFSDVDLEKLMKLVYYKIANRSELKDKFFYDISDSLNNSPPDEYYIDDCHLFSNGNKIVADRILSIMSNYLPQGYIK
jgi:hypothetical protein